MPPSGRDASTPTTHGARRTKWFGPLLAFLLFVASAVGIYYLSADARREINALATANADSSQWALAQSEVELLALLSEARRTEPDTVAHLRSIRRRFDVFYSRIATMRESAILATLREDPAARDYLDEAQSTLDAIVPTIDGPDGELQTALPDLILQVEAIRPLVRNLSLAGIEHFSRISDTQRARVSSALVRLGILTFLLVAALSAVVIALVKANRSATRYGLERSIAQRRAATVVSTSLDAIIVVDVQGRVIEFNTAAEDIFGYSRDEIINQHMSDKIIPDKYHAAHESGMKRYIKTRDPHVVGKGRVQLEAKHKSGRIFPVELSISSADGPDGEIFVSYLRDVSKEVAKQKELVRARDEAVAGERAKANLVAVMSHEMRTPLNGIVGALELLKSTKLDKTQANMTDVMDTSANMLLQHVNDVLDMSRLEAGATEKIMRPYDPGAITTELLDSLQMAASDRGNTIDLVKTDPHFSLVLGDPAKLKQILTNLVGNAIKFTRHGRIVVEIEPHSREGKWELRVIDEGIGISHEDQARVFEDFVTLDPSYTRAQEGTGLGLAIVRRLVQHLGGEIGVESELGKGSVFWVKLPTNLQTGANLTQVVATPTGHDVAMGEVSRPMSVLLVEDNAINRVVATKMLEKLGHQVVEAHNGLEGVALAKSTVFDAILMDISMPELDGVSATQRIRSADGANRETAIFAVTANAMPSDIARFEEAGMTDVLIKPISLDSLARLLQRSKTPADTAASDRLVYWDSAIIDDLRDTVGPDKHDELLAILVREMDTACQLTFLTEDIDDPETLRAEVHRLAGSTSMLGAQLVFDKLAQTESHLAAGDYEAAIAELASVVDCWTATKACLSDF